MPIFYVILFVLFFLTILGVYVVLFDLFLTLEEKLKSILDWFGELFVKLFKLFIPKKLTVSFPKLRNVFMFIVAGLATIYVLVSFLLAEDTFACFQSIVLSTSIGSAVELFQSGFDLQGQIVYAGLVAVAFSSFLSYVYMKFTILNLNTLNLHRVIYWLLFVAMNVLFIACSSLLTDQMAVIFSKAADMIFGLYTRLSGKVSTTSVKAFWDAFPVVGCYILLIPIAVGTFLTTVITVREYLANLFYGLASLLIVIAVGLLVSWIADKVTNFPVFISDVCIVLSMFLVDYIRADDTANTKFTNIIHAISEGLKKFICDILVK